MQGDLASNLIILKGDRWLRWLLKEFFKSSSDDLNMTCWLGLLLMLFICCQIKMLHRKMSCESGLEKLGQNPSSQKSAMLSVLLGLVPALPPLAQTSVMIFFCVFFNSRTLLNALSLLLLGHLSLTMCFCQNAQSWLSASPQAQPGSTRNHCAVAPAPESHTWVKTSAFHCCHLSLPALLAICSTTETQWIFSASSEHASVVCSSFQT